MHILPVFPFQRQERPAKISDPMTQSSSSAADGHDRMMPKVILKLLDKNTGQSKLEADLPDIGSSVIPGNLVMPMGVPPPVDHLQPGSYAMELRASDSAGQSSVARKAEFTVE